MRRILQHVMKWAWSIVMKGDMDHCDEMGREHCDDRDSWIIVMTSVMEPCADKDH